MGLDMYVYSVHKPDLDTGKVYDRSDLKGTVIGEDEINEPMFRQLIPYCEKVRVVNHYYNMEKIGEDYDLTDARLGGWSCGDGTSITTICGYKDGVRKSVEIPDDLIESKYTIDREEICYVCEEEEVHYWRKAYDIQDWFHDHIKEPVENTGYYILSEKMLKAFNRKFPQDKLPVEAPDETSALVYWEWY